jgi:hypothetical protein
MSSAFIPELENEHANVVGAKANEFSFYSRTRKRGKVIVTQTSTDLDEENLKYAPVSVLYR